MKDVHWHVLIVTYVAHSFPSHLARSRSAANLTDNLVRKSVPGFANALRSILVTIPGSYFVRLAHARPAPKKRCSAPSLLLAKMVAGEGAERAKKIVEREGFRSRQRVPPGGEGVLTEEEEECQLWIHTIITKACLSIYHTGLRYAGRVRWARYSRLTRVGSRSS